MDHSLITTLSAGFGIALLFGFAAERMKFPALVGYLLAGILIGPASPGFVADVNLASQLSEIGIMLLMFGVGLHFSLNDLLAVRKIALPGAIAQMGLATLLGMLVAMHWGWSWGSGLVFGVSLSCASTVVLLKALEAKDLLNSIKGKIAVGWLVTEDLATVLVLVLLPPLGQILQGSAGADSVAVDFDWTTLLPLLGETLLQVSAFVAVMLVAGQRVLPWILLQVARTGSRELFTLAVITGAIGIAYLAATLFNVSAALGAFFAGMVMRGSEYSHRAAEESLPFRDAFSVLFFVAVGMLFKPQILVEQPWHVLGVVSIIIFGKSIAACFIVLFLKYPLHTALTVSASLAQIGEFSFILAGLGISLNLLPQDALSLILAGALISIAANPLVFAAVGPVQRWVLAHSAFARRLEQRQDPFSELPRNTEVKYLKAQVVLVGYGQVGQKIAMNLKAHGIPYVVAEQNRETVENLRKEGYSAVAGDATDPAVLIQAHIANAAMLVVSTQHPVNVQQMVDTAKALNPNIEIVTCTDAIGEPSPSDDWKIFSGKEVLAKSMTTYVLARFEPAEE